MSVNHGVYSRHAEFFENIRQEMVIDSGCRKQNAGPSMQKPRA